MAGLDPVFPVSARAAIALLFAAALRHKIADPLRFEGIVADYRITPKSWSSAVARGVVVLEATLLVALLAPWTARGAAVSAGVVLCGYGLAIAVNLARGRREIECGCGGVGERLRPRLLLRNATLIGVCLVAATSATDRALVAMDFVTIGVGLACLSLLWQAAGLLASLGDAAAVASRRSM